VFIFMPCFVIGQGMQPIVGFNYGARKYDRVFKALKLSMSWATGIALAGFIVFYLFPAHIMGVFTTEEDLIARTVYATRRMLVGIYLIGFISVASILFQALGKAMQSFIASVARPALLLIPVLYLMAGLFQLDGIWYTFPITDVLTALVILALMMPLIRDLRKQRDAEKLRGGGEEAPVFDPAQVPVRY